MTFEGDFLSVTLVLCILGWTSILLCILGWTSILLCILGWTSILLCILGWTSILLCILGWTSILLCILGWTSILLCILGWTSILLCIHLSIMGLTSWSTQSRVAPHGARHFSLVAYSLRKVIDEPTLHEPNIMLFSFTHWGMRTVTINIQVIHIHLP